MQLESNKNEHYCKMYEIHAETERKIQKSAENYRLGNYRTIRDGDNVEEFLKIERRLMPKSISEEYLDIQRKAGNYKLAKHNALSYLNTLYPERRYTELPTTVLFSPEKEKIHALFTDNSLNQQLINQSDCILRNAGIRH